jgi:predicted phage terminase large subunit-like protein
MNAPFANDKLQRFGKAYAEYFARVAKHQQSQRGWYDDDGVRQGGLIAFVRYFWHVLEPETPFVDGWPLWAMCEHLEAATFGEINRLLMNVPPGFMKSMLTDVFWPAWEWGPMKKTHYRYIAFSYSASLTERDNDRFRTLITSAQYQKLYGPMRVKVKAEQMPFEERDELGQVTLRNKTTIKVINTATGWKLASSVGGVATGERGDRVIIDDPHSVLEAESDRVRSETVRWFRESISSRFNNLDTGALVIIMQRVHYDDVSGVALGPGFDYCHCMIPWEFDPDRQGIYDETGDVIPNGIGWTDPRAGDTEDEAEANEPAWTDRFSDKAIATMRAEMGPYAWSSQMNQAPVPRGEGIFKAEWWQVWEPADGKFPIFEYVIGSLDGAFTEDEENDPSGFTVWGIFTTTEGKRAIMLVHAWRKHLQFSAPRVHRLKERTQIEGQWWPAETVVVGMEPAEVKRRNAMFKRRTSDKWGLIEWVQDTCIQYKVDKLLIEAKASGISAAQEIQNRYGIQDFDIQLMPVKGDKVARALSVQPTLSQGMVWAPDRDWSDMVIEEASKFPKFKYDDLTDSMTQALRYLRDVGLAQTDEEAAVVEREEAMLKPKRRALYPV